jgi:hypothetical protein
MIDEITAGELAKLFDVTTKTISLLSSKGVIVKAKKRGSYARRSRFRFPSGSRRPSTCRRAWLRLWLWQRVIVEAIAESGRA